MAIDSTNRKGDTMLPLKYGDIERDFHAMPESSQIKLANEGFTHWLGNRANSRAAGKVKALDGVTDVAEWRKSEDNEAQFQAWLSEVRDEFLRDMDEGTMSHREGGPRKVKTLEDFKIEAAVRWLKHAIKSSKGKPLPSDPNAMYELDDVTISVGELIQRKINGRDAKQILSEAEGEFRNYNRKRENATRAAIGGATAAESLGI